LNTSLDADAETIVIAVLLTAYVNTIDVCDVTVHVAVDAGVGVAHDSANDSVHPVAAVPTVTVPALSVPATLDPVPHDVAVGEVICG
jgi:hypothetical protein